MLHDINFQPHLKEFVSANVEFKLKIKAQNKMAGSLCVIVIRFYGNSM